MITKSDSHLNINGLGFNSWGELIITNKEVLKKSLLELGPDFEKLRLTSIMPDCVGTEKLLEEIIEEVRSEMNITEDFV